MARKKKTENEIKAMNQRRRDIQDSIHEAYRPIPNYDKIEKLSKEMAEIDEQLYELELKERK